MTDEPGGVTLLDLLREFDGDLGAAPGEKVIVASMAVVSEGRDLEMAMRDARLQWEGEADLLADAEAPRGTVVAFRDFDPGRAREVDFVHVQAVAGATLQAMTSAAEALARVDEVATEWLHCDPGLARNVVERVDMASEREWIANRAIEALEVANRELTGLRSVL